MATRSEPVPIHGHGNAWWLARQLQQQIRDGRYAPGEKLPSYRKLMEEFALTSGTVSYAMSILAEQGVVDRRHGSGVYVQLAKSSVDGKFTESGLCARVVPEIESGLYLSLQAGMEIATRANREQLITMTTGSSTTQQADAMLQLIDRGVAGIALVPCYEPSHAYQLRHLHRSGVPLVLLHRSVADVPAPVIRIPFSDVGKLAGQAIAERGHKAVAAFVGSESETTAAYLDGFRQGLDPYGVVLDEDCVLSTESMLITGQSYARFSMVVDQFLDRLFALPIRPTAIFVTFDRLAELIYATVSKRSMRVPEDLSILCFGNRRAGLDSVPLGDCRCGRTWHGSAGIRVACSNASWRTAAGKQRSDYDADPSGCWSDAGVAAKARRQACPTSLAIRPRYKFLIELKLW